MYLLGMLDIGKTALFANLRALNIVSHNIANINTPGFSRQEVILSTMPPAMGKGGTVGRGVSIAGIRRSYEEYIQSQLLRQYQNFGRSTSLLEAYSRIEQIFNEAKDFGLSKALNDYFNAWQEVATNPEGTSQRVILIQNAQTLTNAAKRIEQDLLENIKHINEELKNLISQINTIAKNIATLNEKIVQVEVGNTGAALDFRDQRQHFLNQLSELIDYSSYEDELGNVNIAVGMRNLVYGVKTNPLTLELLDNGNRELFLDGINISSYIEKGKVGGLLDVRDEIHSTLQLRFRKLIASLIKEVNLLHRIGYGLDGSTDNNFFVPFDLFIKDFSDGANITSSVITDINALTLDEYDITFDSANNYYVINKRTGSIVSTGIYDSSGTSINFDGINLVITGAVSNKDKFFVSPLTHVIKNFKVAITDPNKIAASSNNMQLPGNNENALAIVRLSQSQIMNLGSLTFSNYYRGIVAEIATLASASRDSFAFEENLLMEISRRRESISGVSLDEEALNLIKFQRAYEASAKMIKVTDELLQTILEL